MKLCLGSLSILHIQVLQCFHVFADKKQDYERQRKRDTERTREKMSEC